MTIAIAVAVATVIGMLLVSSAQQLGVVGGVAGDIVGRHVTERRHCPDRRAAFVAHLPPCHAAARVPGQIIPVGVVPPTTAAAAAAATIATIGTSHCHHHPFHQHQHSK